MTDTQTPTLETLLRRWAELEPARCRIELPESVWCCGMDRFLIGSQIDLVFIQCAVQEAIEARGWVWRVRGHGNYAVAWVWFNILSSDHEQTADTPAAALLSAYLQALEALKP